MSHREAGERHATVGPRAVGGDEIDMSKWHEVMAVFLWGNMAAEALDTGLQSSSKSGGSYSNISGKQITQQAAHASNNDNLQHVVSLQSEEITNRYVKARMVTGNTTGGPAAYVVLGRGRFKPGTGDNLSSEDVPVRVERECEQANHGR